MLQSRKSLENLLAIDIISSHLTNCNNKIAHLKASLILDKLLSSYSTYSLLSKNLVNNLFSRFSTIFGKLFIKNNLVKNIITVLEGTDGEARRNALELIVILPNLIDGKIELIHQLFWLLESKNFDELSIFLKITGVVANLRDKASTASMLTFLESKFPLLIANKKGLFVDTLVRIYSILSNSIGLSNSDFLKNICELNSFFIVHYCLHSEVLDIQVS